MVCQSCGGPVQGAFCSKCGAPVYPPPSAQAAPTAYAPPPAAMYEPRVVRHLQTMGILWCVYGAYRAMAGMVAPAVLDGGLPTPAFMGGMGPRGMSFLPFAPVMGGLAAVAGGVILLSSCLSFATGFGLMTRKPWGRSLAIAVAILSLIKIPFGTALGIYTLWVLAPTGSGMEYDAIADHS